MPTLHDIAAEHAQRVARQYAAPPPVADEAEMHRAKFMRLLESARDCADRKIDAMALSNAAQKASTVGHVIDWSGLCGKIDGALQILVGQLNHERGHDYLPTKGNSSFSTSLGVLPVKVEYFYRPPVAGRLSGPPEDCYEDDPGEFDFVWIVIGGVRVEPDCFAPDVLATWELAIREAADEQHNDAMAARAERERDYE